MPSKKPKGFRRISDKAVKTATGKSSREWYAILDQWNLKKYGHTAAAKHLQKKYKLTPWWAQCLTIRYEWERGLRK